MRTRQATVLTLLIAAAAALPLTGCDDAQVRSYTAVKDDEPAPRQRTEPIVWKLPDGWAAYPDTSGMRYVTVYTGKGEGQMEVSVSHLPGDAGGWTANVNRWRGQIGLDPLTPDTAKEQIELVQIGGQPAALLDMTGAQDDDETGEKPRMLAAMVSDGMRTWFFKATEPVSVIEQHKPAFTQWLQTVRFPALDAAHAAQATNPAPTPRAPQDDVPDRPTPLRPPTDAAEATAEGGLKYDVPEGWAAGPPTAFAMATLTFGQGEQAGRVTVSRLGGDGGGLMANINRWRGQAGVPPAPTLEQAAETMEVGGKPGYFVDAVQEGAADNTPRITGVIVPDTGFTWFIKMTGPNAAVEQQQAAFRQFVKSLHWPQ